MAVAEGIKTPGSKTEYKDLTKNLSFLELIHTILSSLTKINQHLFHFLSKKHLNSLLSVQ